MKKHQIRIWAFGLGASLIMLHAGTLQGQDFPGVPEENGLTPRTDTIYINTPDTINNDSTESLGVDIDANGNIIVGWEDDGDGLTDLAAVWTQYDAEGNPITPETTITSQAEAGTLDSRFLAYFRSDGSAVPGNTAWGPKIKADPFGDGFGMGATAYGLGAEIDEFADINLEAGGAAGDFPAVQIMNNDGTPRVTLAGVSDEFAEEPGDIRIADWGFLANGNIVIVGESRQEDDLVLQFDKEAPNLHAIYTILDQDGNIVLDTSLVSETGERVEMWHGVGVTANGFGLRFSKAGRQTVRLFNNDGTPLTGDLDVAELVGGDNAEDLTGGGRGDGAGFHGNGTDAYVITNNAGQFGVYITVLNADGTVRYSRVASDDFEFTSADRVDANIDQSGRVVAAWADSDAGGGVPLPVARVFDADGEPLGGSFFIGENDNIDNFTGEGRRPRVAIRDNTVAIVWQSQNSGVTNSEVVALRIFDLEGTSVNHFELY